ncbi:hypothetical protein TNCT_192901 [Trichonephila clavata]|uniref:Uncharacterized protein n=1 Tax=Trichonephila clavata TaxID=2740835 RepID=A0A8X6GCD7_TRICU|nr:hypothetical protein TNCT_192901 [Trichonephila clavata]
MVTANACVHDSDKHSFPHRLLEDLEDLEQDDLAYLLRQKLEKSVFTRDKTRWKTLITSVMPHPQSRSRLLSYS